MPIHTPLDHKTNKVVLKVLHVFERVVVILLHLMMMVVVGTAVYEMLTMLVTSLDPSATGGTERLLDAIEVSPFPDPVERDVHGRVEQNRQVGPGIAVHPVRQAVDGFHGETAATALVRAARVRKSITDDPRARLQRRQNGVIQVERARGEHQQQFGDFGDGFITAIQDDVPNIVGKRRTARLACRHYLVAGGLDADGRRVPAGIYFARLDGPPENQSLKLYSRDDELLIDYQSDTGNVIVHAPSGNLEFSADKGR